MQISRYITGLDDKPSSPSLLSKSFPLNDPYDIISYFDLPNNQGHLPKDMTSLFPDQENPVDDQISMDYLPPCSQPLMSSQDNKFSILPLTTSRKVDILYIDKLRQHDSPSTLFHQFCLNTNFLQQMMESGFEFGYPTSFSKAVIDDRFDLLQSLQIPSALTKRPSNIG